VKYFRAKVPASEIHAVEPDPVSLVALRANTRDDPAVVVHPVAVAARTGVRAFYMSRHGWASSLAGDRRAAGGHWVSVEAYSLEDLLARTGHARVGLLKIDAEGAEWEVFASTELGRHADTVVGELHDRDQHPDDHLLPGVTGLRLEFTDPPDDTCFVARRAADGEPGALGAR
jgi:FkbM family methyltransferase